jgi:hypothetical protein
MEGSVERFIRRLVGTVLRGVGLMVKGREVGSGPVELGGREWRRPELP